MAPPEPASPLWGSVPVSACQSKDSRIADVPEWFGALLIVGLWLLARPYIGMRHDGVLYMGQTLLQLKPDALSDDLFFAYGSQDKFSIFSWLTARLHQSFGWASTQMLVLVVCHAGLLVAAAIVVRPVLSPVERWSGLAALAVVSHGYGGLGIFSFAETFVTARTLAEPLALLAVAALLSGRSVLAVLCLGAAALAHPLVALPVVVVCWLLQCKRDPRWRWALLLLALPVALAVADFGPFSALLKRFDPEWIDLVVEVNGHVFVSRWGLIDWQVVVLDACLLAAAARCLPAPLARLCGVTLIVALTLIAISLIGADLFKNVLITGLQLWRVLWLAHLLAIACSPALLLLLWRSRETIGRLSATATALAALAANAYWPSAWLLEVWAAITVLLYCRKQPLSPDLARFAVLATVVALVVLSIASVARNATSLVAAGAELDAAMWLWLLFTTPTLALALTAALMWAVQVNRAHALAASVVVWTMTAAGTALWDRRPAWIEFVESAFPGQHPFAQHVAPQAQVYWHGELAATWSALARPSFFSTQQGAGLLFNRPTAMEFARRRPAFATLNFQQEICGIVAALNPSAHKDDCAPDQVVVDEICQFPNGPDYLVLPYKLARGVIAEWKFSAASKRVTYYLYECHQLR